MTVVHHSCNPTHACLSRCRCDRWVLEASRPTEKHPTDVNAVSCLWYMLHEHRENKGPRFEEIEEKLPSNWVYFSLDFHQEVRFALLLPLPYRALGQCPNGLQTVRSAKVRQHHPASTTKRDSEQKWSTITHVSWGFHLVSSNVGAPSYPATARAIKVLLVTRCVAHGRGCGCEICEWCTLP